MLQKSGCLLKVQIKRKNWISERPAMGIKYAFSGSTKGKIFFIFFLQGCSTERNNLERCKRRAGVEHRHQK